MAIYAISDLHLSFGNNKSMDIFGTNWKNHTKKIEDEWKKTVKNDDVIILPGDFSWAMYLEDTYKDFEYLNNLPGKKILLKGNHDYWWTTLKKIKNYLEINKFNNINFIQNNSFLYNNTIISGTRGWGDNSTMEDKKIINREILRLEMSLKNGISNFGEDKNIIVCMHFPPFIDNRFSELMEKYNVKKCIYGHLHGQEDNLNIDRTINNIEYKLVSCDYLKFKVIKVL